MKKYISVIICAVMVFWMCIPAVAVEENAPFDVAAKSAVLMDAGTGQVLYAKNADRALPPASVTKVMTLLLIMEAIDSGDLKLSDTVTVSEYAASMGGSQVFLEPFEEMSVDDLLKAVVVSSANDGAVALAERVAGSEESFVALMNKRAGELGMKNTHFENVTGLDDDVKNHTISALDIALCSRELITKHPLILNYSTIWMDTIRNGAFGLSNTNRLIRFYNGATGLKTGSTAKAGFCISATASRDGMHLIAVIMGSKTRDERNGAAAKLLDWGFANFCVYKSEGAKGENIPVKGGIKSKVSSQIDSFSALLSKGEDKNVTVSYDYKKSVAAPVKKGDKLGEVIYKVGDRELGRESIYATEDIPKISFGGVLIRILKNYLLY